MVLHAGLIILLVRKSTQRNVSMSSTLKLPGLKAAREKENLTQELLAELAGVSERTIQRIEKGHATSQSTAEAIALKLEKHTLSDLSSDTSGKPVSDSKNVTVNHKRSWFVRRLPDIITVTILAFLFPYTLSSHHPEYDYYRSVKGNITNSATLMSLAIKDMELADAYTNDHSAATAKEIIEHYIKLESDYADELTLKIRKINDYTFEDCTHKPESWGVGPDSTLMDVMELMSTMEKHCPKHLAKENAKKDDLKQKANDEFSVSP